MVDVADVAEKLPSYSNSMDPKFEVSSVREEIALSSIAVVSNSRKEVLLMTTIFML